MANETARRDASFTPADFDFDPETRCCICPAGKPLYGNGSECTINGCRVMKFQGVKQDCQPCALRAQCLRNPAKTISRQVSFFLGRRKVDGRWELNCMVYNIEKLAHHGYAL